MRLQIWKRGVGEAKEKGLTCCSWPGRRMIPRGLILRRNSVWEGEEEDDDNDDDEGEGDSEGRFVEGQVKPPCLLKSRASLTEILRLPARVERLIISGLCPPPSRFFLAFHIKALSSASCRHGRCALTRPTCARGLHMVIGHRFGAHHLLEANATTDRLNAAIDRLEIDLHPFK